MAPFSLSLLAAALSTLYNTLKLGRDFFLRIGTWKRNRKTKKEYKRIEKISENGKVDEINDIFKP
jgi:hypothetical protein